MRPLSIQQSHMRALFLTLIVSLAMLAVACGGEDVAGEPTVTPTSPASTPTTAAPQETATQPSSPTQQSGSLVVAVQSVGASPSGLPRDCPVCEFLTNASVQDVLLRSVNDSGDTLTEEAGLAEEWTLAEDGSYTDFTIREGVQFHGGFGELTAEDVAWTFNEAIAEGSVHATKSEIDTAFAQDSTAEAIDERTVRMFWNAFGVSTYPKTVTGYREGVGIFSKTAFDENGADWMRDNVIGTGPFQLDEWTAGSRMSLTAVSDHWLQTPSVATVTYLEVPESSSRRAMLQSGEAQIAEVAVSDWPALISNDRFETAPAGATVDYALIMGGNYWEKTHPVSGEPLQRELHADELAWVGDPDDPESMERALKVRQALSTSIDRDGINQALFSGLARSSYVGGVNDEDPVVMRVVDPIPFDPAAARQLLQDAGYPDGGFDVEIYAREAGSTDDEIARVLAAEWGAELGVNVNINNAPYATYRPNFINRTVDTLSFRTGGAFAPSTWEEEWYVSASVSNTDGTPGGGFNSGMEIPVASETLMKKQEAAGLDEVVEATEEYLRYMQNQALWPGTVEFENSAVYDPAAICEWNQLPMATAGLGGARNLETVKLCDS